MMLLWRKMRQHKWDAEHRSWCFPDLSCGARLAGPALLLLVFRPLSELLRPLSICISNMGTSILVAMLGKVLLEWSWPTGNEWNSYQNVDSEEHMKWAFWTIFRLPDWLAQNHALLSSLNGYTSAVSVTWAAPSWNITLPSGQRMTCRAVTWSTSVKWPGALPFTLFFPSPIFQETSGRRGI